MSRLHTVYLCSNCDSQFPKWSGRCPECGQWGTLHESSAAAGKDRTSVMAAVPTNLEELSGTPHRRFLTGLREFDRVLGGGLTTDSIVLLGGEPGIGKSTLALQIANHVSAQGSAVVYVSGEESAAQVGQRLSRIQRQTSQLTFLSETSLDTVLATLERIKPQLVVIDSIQTMTVADVDGEPGSVQQIRAATTLLLKAAKLRNLACLITGHVTKEGVVAGPRALEHLVDVVVYMEGDPTAGTRILRATKNRFGATNETGIFTLTDRGLEDVSDPSTLFLADRHLGPGTVAAAVLEGSRPLVVDIQALASPTAFGNPRRTANGLEQSRLHVLVAVLTRRAGLKQLASQDLFVNVVGGLAIRERAADAAASLAIASSVLDFTVSHEIAVLGEIGLGGELRRVSEIDRRAKELDRLGFKKILTPKQPIRLKLKAEILAFATLPDALGYLRPRRRA